MTLDIPCILLFVSISLLNMHAPESGMWCANYLLILWMERVSSSPAFKGVLKRCWYRSLAICQFNGQPDMLPVPGMGHGWPGWQWSRSKNQSIKESRQFLILIINTNPPFLLAHIQYKGIIYVSCILVSLPASILLKSTMTTRSLPFDTIIELNCRSP